MRTANLRVALISEHASPLAAAGSVDAGGQNIYVAQVAQGLADAGHQVDVLTRRDDPRLPAAVDLRPGVRVMHIDAGPSEFVPKEKLLGYMPSFIDAARRLFEHRGGYDVIHANFFMSGYVGLALRRRFGVPLAVTFHALGLVRLEHQGAADGFPPQRVAIERALVQRAERVIAECPQDEADLVRLYGARRERLACVPCGVDTQAFRPGDKARARQRLGLPAHEFIVLQLGRLVPRKGVDNVIRAMAGWPDGIDARLVIVGGATSQPDERATPEIARLRAVARISGVDSRVHFAGRRDRHELRDWYVAADAFVTTPWYEPFGITPLEAMACATPVVGSAVGGIAHTVVHGVTGFLVPPHGPGALRERLLELQRNPALAAALGRAGVHRVRSLFTWERVASQLARVYTEIRRAQRLPQRPLLSLVPRAPASASASASASMGAP
jgi:D-inositol-3-phosphate glycosyltransferase